MHNNLKSNKITAYIHLFLHYVKSTYVCITVHFVQVIVINVTRLTLKLESPCHHSDIDS